MYSVLPYLNGYLPPAFLKFLDAFSFSFFNFKFLKSLQPSFVNDIIDEIDYVHPFMEYRENQFESGSYFVNQLQLMLTFLTIAALHLTLLLLFKILSWKINHPLFIFVQIHVKDMLHFKVYIRLIIEAYLFAFLAAFNEFFRFRNASSHPFSYTV